MAGFTDATQFLLPVRSYRAKAYTAVDDQAEEYARLLSVTLRLPVLARREPFLPSQYVSSLMKKAETDSAQVIEHYRNLWNFVRVIHEKEEDGTSICNPNSCPRMSAGQ
jgi:hypothetical protein